MKQSDKIERYIAETLEYLKINQVCQNCIENNQIKHTRNIETIKNHQEENSKSNNATISLYYVSLFIIFTFAYKEIPTIINLQFSKCILVSIFFFFINDLHRNYINEKVDKSLRKTVKNIEDKNNLEQHKAVEIWFKNISKEYDEFTKFWYIYYATSLTTGISAVILLFIGLFYYHI